MEAPDWAMWHPPIHPFHPLPFQHHVILSCHCATSSVQNVQTAMWHNPFGPRIDLKVPKLGDMWKPLVLPITMMTST
jgi:hypothetical protein